MYGTTASIPHTLGTSSQGHSSKWLAWILYNLLLMSIVIGNILEEWLQDALGTPTLHVYVRDSRCYFV